MKIKLLFIISLILVSCQDERTSDQLISDIKIQIHNAEFQNALKDIDKLISKKIETSETYTLKGQCENELGKESESLLSFQKAIELDGNNYDAYVERANLKLKLGDYQSAIEDCNSAMLMKKDYAKTYKTKARAYELLEDEPNAIIQYQAAIKYGDNSGENNYKLGVLLLNKANYKDGCKYLSIAGEKGYMDAYDLIKTNCNERFENSNDNDSTKGQFRSYPDKFAVRFPSNWNIDKISNSDNSTFAVYAFGTKEKDGSITITETEPIILDPSFKPKTIFDINSDAFIKDSRNKYEDFKLLEFKKLSVDDADAYYFEITFSFYSTKLQKRLSDIYYHYVFLHPKTNKIYNIICQTNNENAEYNRKLLDETINSFKFL